MIQLGIPDQFAAVRALLGRAQYGEDNLCRRFGITSLENFEEEFDRTQLNGPEDATGALLQLFVEGQYVPVDMLDKHLGSEALQAMASLGMLEHNPDDPQQIAATIALYPTGGVWIVSDRWNSPDRGAYTPPQDVVYPAIVSNAQRFLKFMPRTPCRSMLDLCSGTAVAALRAANEFAGHAWAVDIAPRSTLFGEFNRRLNGLHNVTVATGDLYQRAEGRRFDRIVAHPPYVPVLRPKWIYQDGGLDGEQIVRGVMSGLPQHLEPGGLFYLLAMGSDRESGRYEERVRSWLAEQESDFDVAVFVLRSVDPEEFAVRAALNSRHPADDSRELKRLYQSLGATQMVYSVVLIQRRDEPRSVATVRRQNGPGTTIEHMLEALRWETSLLKPGGLDRLMSSRIRANREAEMRVNHQLTDEGWEAADYVLRTSAPFSMEARTDPWAPYLMAQCDGSKTVAEHYQDLLDQEALPRTVPPEDFARAVAVLISGGFLLL